MTQAKASLFKWGWGCLFPGSENGGKSSLLKNRNDLCRIFLISFVRYECKHLYQLLVHRHFPLKHIVNTSTWCNKMGFRTVKASLDSLDINRGQQEIRLVPTWVLTKSLHQKNTMATATVRGSDPTVGSYRWNTLPSIGSPVKGCHLVPMKVGIFRICSLKVSRCPLLHQRAS